MKRWRAAGEPAPEVLDELAAILRGGGVALLPTDTIYGLHAAAGDEAAVERIAAMKGRQEGKPFIVLAASPEQLEELGCLVPEVLREVWPAPLTAVLARGANTLAARIPDVAWLRALLERTGPLVSTSANRSGEPAVSEPELLAPDLLVRLDAMLDAGLLAGKPSAIVDFTRGEPHLLREGDTGFTQNLRKTLRIRL
jgi:L-threonylcarbamoyladenylate synthase